MRSGGGGATRASAGSLLPGATAGAGSPDAEAEPRRYTRVAVILHWLIAALILSNLAAGYLMDRATLGWRLFAVEMHASAGLTILALTMVRVAWRLAHRPPERAVPLNRWERATAHIVHLALYGAMLLMPLSGWALISANPPRGSAGWNFQAAQLPPAVNAALESHGPLSFWHIAELPTVPALGRIGEQPAGLGAQKRLHDELAYWHGAGSFLLLALLVLHVAGALKHQWFDGEAELARMAIRRRRSRRYAGEA